MNLSLPTGAPTKAGEFRVAERVHLVEGGRHV